MARFVGAQSRTARVVLEEMLGAPDARGDYDGESVIEVIIQALGEVCRSAQD